MADRLVIEIDGDASGLTKALSQGQAKLTQFNTNVSAGNKALTGLLAKINSTAAGFGRLGAASATLRSNFNSLNRSILTADSSIARLTKQANAGAASLRAFGTALGSAQRRVEGLSASAKGASSSLTSLNRRAAALGTTVSAVNASLRTFLRTLNSASGAARGGTTIINNYGSALSRAGGAAARNISIFNRLNRANISLMEGFRRHVAQITALRTLTYQAIFWFGPLVYSIIKVNAAYEKQMQLLKNLSGEVSELAKQQWAEQTRQQLIKLANTNPFSLEQITNTFVRLKVTGLDPLNGSMQTLMDSIAAFGGSNDELDRAGIALQQMVGKSAVSMEELRQQLGEHIPDAMKAMATGMGLSMAEFYKQVSQGTVEAKDAINKMLVVLANSHYGAAKTMMNTWNGLMARMGTAWQNFIARIEHGTERSNTFIQTLKNNVEQLITFLNTPAGVNFANSVEHALAAFVNGVRKAIQIAYEWRDLIITVAKVLAVMWGGRLVIGTILSVVKTLSTLSTGLKALITIFRVFTGVNTAAAGAAAIFGRNTLAAKTATSAMNSVVQATSSSLLGIVSRFALATGGAIAFAGAVWAVVTALNAQTMAQRNANLAKSGKEGGAWTNSDMSDRSGDRYKATKDLNKQAKARKEGGYWVTSEVGSHFVEWTPEKEKQYQDALAGYRLKDATTVALQRQNTNTAYKNFYARDVTTSVKNYWNSRKKGVTDPKKLQEIEAQEAKAMSGALSNDNIRLTAELSRTNDPEQRQAIEDLINENINGQKQFSYDITTPNVSIAGKKEGKTKKSKEDHTLENLQTKYESTFVGTEDLAHQLADLTNRTDTEFDTEVAQEKAKQNMRGKTIQQLRDMIEAEKVRREELQKSIKVEKAIIDIENESADTLAKTAEEVDNLQVSYNSIDLAVEHYKQSLERSHQTELTIAEQRVAQGRATEEQIKQYIRLKEAIDSAVRAKQAELVVDAAKDAKAANEEYFARLRSPTQQAQYEADIETLRYSEALARANELASMQKEIDADIEQAKIALADATQRAADATDDETRALAKRDIVVIANKLHDDEAAQAAIASIPYLQQRLDIIKEETRVREQWGGAGGPLFAWALPAAQAFQDLGASMGSLFASSMDQFIDSLGEGKAAFADFAKSIIKGLIGIIIKGVIAKAILSALGLTMGTPTGGGFDSMSSLYGGGMVGDIASAGIAHTGGIAGSGGLTRSVPSEMFAFAQRYHTGGVIGLKANEIPIIAERGEGVFTREQMSALGKPQPNNVEINVINQTGVAADAQRGQPKFDGEKYIETIILKKMATPGPVRDGLVAMTGKR